MPPNSCEKARVLQKKLRTGPNQDCADLQDQLDKCSVAERRGSMIQGRHTKLQASVTIGSFKISDVLIKHIALLIVFV